MYTTRKTLINDWRRYCLEYPKTIAYCGPRKFIEKTSNHVYLIKGENKTRYVELRSYSLFLALQEMQFNVLYKDSTMGLVALCVEIIVSTATIYIHYDQQQSIFKYYQVREDELQQLQEIDCLAYAEMQEIALLQKQLLAFEDPFTKS